MRIRKLTALFVALIVIFSVSCVLAAEGNKTIRVYFDGEEVSFREPPQFYNGRLIVPVRPFLETLGTQIAWDSERGSVTTTWEDKTIIFYVNDYMVEINGSIVEVDTPAVIVGGTTMLPLRTFSELFGLQVKWDGEVGVVEVESKNYVPFEKVKGISDLPPAVSQWIDVTKWDEANTTLELEDHLYILSSLGWKPTGGYDVRIRRITWDNNTWLVNVQTKEPLPGQPTIQVISNPYDLVRLDLASVGRPSSVVFRTIKR